MHEAGATAAFHIFDEKVRAGGAAMTTLNSRTPPWSQENLAELENGWRGPWCFGSQPTLADVCLVPQVANALRMGCDLSAYPKAMAVVAHANTHPAFAAAAPARQPDYKA
jgi:glutathione S-transferase